MSEETQILIQIREQLIYLNSKIDSIKLTLESDRSMMWKVLGLTIAGAFALIGIKMVFP
jgi:hypothetical protein